MCRNAEQLPHCAGQRGLISTSPSDTAACSWRQRRSSRPSAASSSTASAVFPASHGRATLSTAQTALSQSSSRLWPLLSRHRPPITAPSPPWTALKETAARYTSRDLASRPVGLTSLESPDTRGIPTWGRVVAAPSPIPAMLVARGVSAPAASYSRCSRSRTLAAHCTSSAGTITHDRVVLYTHRTAGAGRARARAPRVATRARVGTPAPL